MTSRCQVHLEEDWSTGNTGFHWRPTTDAVPRPIHRGRQGPERSVRQCPDSAAWAWHTYGDHLAHRSPVLCLPCLSDWHLTEGLSHSTVCRAWPCTHRVLKSQGGREGPGMRRALLLQQTADLSNWRQEPAAHSCSEGRPSPMAHLPQEPLLIRVNEPFPNHPKSPK